MNKYFVAGSLILFGFYVGWLLASMAWNANTKIETKLISPAVKPTSTPAPKMYICDNEVDMQSCFEIDPSNIRN